MLIKANLCVVHVFQLLSGDSVVIRGQPKGGPPPERILGLSGIVAPRLGRRATQTGDQETSGTRDEVCTHSTTAVIKNCQNPIF